MSPLFETPAAYMRRRQAERRLAAESARHRQLDCAIRWPCPDKKSDIFGPVSAGTMIDNERRAQERYERVVRRPHAWGELRVVTVAGFPM